MNTYFTSDTHFGHKNIIKFCNRPFDSVTEMNEGLIENWNKTVKPEDTVYHLGDFAFCPDSQANEIIARLNGTIHLINGNHDRGKKYAGFASRSDLKEIALDICDMKTSIVMCHYSMRVWNKSHHGALMLYGHSHGDLGGNTQSLDVGVDAWNYSPVGIDEIVARMKMLEEYTLGHH